MSIQNNCAQPEALGGNASSTATFDLAGGDTTAPAYSLSTPNTGGLFSNDFALVVGSLSVSNQPIP